MKAAVIAPRGKMGSAVVKAAAERQDFTLIAGVGRKGGDYIGKDLGQAAGLGCDLGVPVVDDLEQVVDQCDVIIDFSTIDAAAGIIRSAVRHRKALVCGTTGFTEQEFEQFQAAAKTIPIVYAPNTSKMVNMMSMFAEFAVREFGEELDVEILDMHDRWKKDAPSGTALGFGERLAEQKGAALKEIAVFGRGGTAPRKPGTIGYHALRAGDIPSSHIIYLGGMGERLELAHHSYSLDCFARGACDCAAFLVGKELGLYSARDAFCGGTL